MPSGRFDTSALRATAPAAAEREAARKLRRALVQATLALVTVVLVSGGLVQGATALQYVLQLEGAFAEYCPAFKEAHHAPASQLFCDERRYAMQDFAFAGYLGITTGQVVFGLVLDKFGPRAAAVGGLLLVTGAFGGMAAVPRGTEAGDAWLAPLFAVLGFGGYGPYVSTMCIGTLFANPGMFISLNTGAFVVAGNVFLLVQLLKTDPALQLSSVTVMAAFAALALCFAVLCFLLMPTVAYKKGDAPEMPLFDGLWGARTRRGRALATLRRAEASRLALHRGGDGRGLGAAASHTSLTLSESDVALLGSADRRESDESEGRGRSGTVLDDAPTLASQMLSWRYLGFTLYFTLGHRAQAFYAATARDQLWHHGDKEGVYANLFTILSNLGWIPKPLTGWLFRRPLGYAVCFAVGNVATQAALATNLLSSLAVQPVAMVGLAISRCFFFSAFYAYAHHAWHPAHYGAVVSVPAVVCAVAGIAQTWLQDYSVHHGYVAANAGITVALCSLYIFVVGVWREGRRASKAAQVRG